MASPAEIIVEQIITADVVEVSNTEIVTEIEQVLEVLTEGHQGPPGNPGTDGAPGRDADQVELGYDPVLLFENKLL